MNRYAKIHAAIKAYYLQHGRTLAEWDAVSRNPAKFNAVWRHALRLPAGTLPPPAEWRDIDFSTGELLR